MKISTSGFVLLAVMLLPLGQSLAADSDIEGRWQCVMNYQGSTAGSMMISFNKNGRGSMGSQPFSYRLLDSKTLQIGNGTSSDQYSYHLNRDTLWMKYRDGSTFDCKKQLPEVLPGGLLQAPGTATGLQAGPGTGNEWQLQGTFCYWSGSSSYSSGASYSRSAHISFDGRGNWYYGGAESAFSGNAGQAYSGGGGERGRYRINGDQILYTSNSGEQGMARVNMRQGDGRITEFYLDNELYSPSLCD